MTIGTLVLSIAAVALLLTFLTVMLRRKSENLLISYLQNFTGALFIFSGFVKAIDPLGTAYKMEQYFAEFESTFQGTWFAFLAPVFPRLSEYAASFSVAMIVFEIALGLMLLIGAARRFTAWAFLLLVVFFTFLTGFTYLTAYVPEGVNFFQFAKWGPYVETNMKVTDCGCFGDFIKLEPRVSFLKDVVLLFPALLFVAMPGRMHQLFSRGARATAITAAVAGLTLYCFSNFVWNLPQIDFRPFREGVNIRERKQQEEEAAANVKILAYRMTNRETGKVVELPFEQYMKEFKNYPKEEWELEQVKSEPDVPRTKISDFEVADVDGNDVTGDILSYPGYSFMIVTHKLYGESEAGTVTVTDTTYVLDTIRTGDAITVQRRVVGTQQREESRDVYTWDQSHLDPWEAVVNPVMQAAQEADVRVFAVTAYADPARIDDFRHATQSAYPFFVADDIMLKTIIRSNPGIVLLKDGVVVKKWHHRKLPSFDKIRSEYMP